MTNENAQVEQVDKDLANSLLAAGRTGLDVVEAAYQDVANFRLAATRELEAEAERARRIIKGWADWHRLVEDDPKDDLPYLNGKAWDDAEALADMCLAFLSRNRQPEAAPADGILSQIAAEVDRAMAKFPTWPTDPFHALAVLGEEYGELQKAVLQFCYEKHKGVTLDDIRAEAVQTAAMAIRWISSIERYSYQPGEQHSQQKGPEDE